MFALFLLCLSASVAVLWSLPFFILKLTGIHLFHVKEKQNTNILLRTLECYSTVILDGDKPSGFVCGWWFIGFVKIKTDVKKGGQLEVFLLCTKRQFRHLCPDNSCSDNRIQIQIWERTTCYFDLTYSKRFLDVTNWYPQEQQLAPIEQIVAAFNMRKHCVAYVHGAPGSGKSMLGILLAKRLNAHYCKEWNPTEPGDSISQVYSSICPTFENPLVLMLDEVDTVISSLIRGVAPHKHIAIPVCNKPTWNNMLDNIDLGIYPHLILIMTSNKSDEWVHKQDRSLIRTGRVDVVLQLQQRCEDDLAKQIGITIRR